MHEQNYQQSQKKSVSLPLSDTHTHSQKPDIKRNSLKEQCFVLDQHVHGCIKRYRFTKVKHKRPSKMNAAKTDWTNIFWLDQLV
jgi:hypothetical protein